MSVLIHKDRIVAPLATDGGDARNGGNAEIIDGKRQIPHCRGLWDKPISHFGDVDGALDMAVGRHEGAARHGE